MNIIYNNFVFPNTNKKPLIFIDTWISTFLFKYLNNILYFKQSILFYIYTPFLYFFIIFMRFSLIIQLNILMDIITIDRLNNFPNRFELIYCFWNINLIKSLKLQITANIYNAIFSISSLFPSAAWLERESWDMYGIKFLLHKNLRRILTDYGFKGHPQRKDFPLSGFVEIRFDDLYQSVVIEPIELMQSFRFFSFSNSWNNWYKLNFYG